MKYLLYAIMTCLCLTGCKRCKSLSGHTEVSGRVLDNVTGKPVPNAQVALGILESTWGGVNGQNVEQVTADSKGSYSFKFTALKNKNYYIIAVADNYFENDIEAYPVKEGYRTVDYNIALPPKATIKIHIKKTDMSYDSLSFGCAFSNLSDGTSRFAFGKIVDTNLFYTSQEGGVNKNIYIYIEKFNGQSLISGTSYTHSVYLVPIDTTYVDLNY